MKTVIFKFALCACVFFLCAFSAARAQDKKPAKTYLSDAEIAKLAFDFSKVPGCVIAHSYAGGGKYIGSPSLCALPGGGLVASHDFFGPMSKEKNEAVTLIYESQDGGKTWKAVSRVNAFWSNLFRHGGALYLMGPDANGGRCVIRKSVDGGHTWTEPKDENSGVIILPEDGRGCHTAPVPMVWHNGRIWRAMEFIEKGAKWGSFSSFMMSADENADLLKASSWTLSNAIDFPVAARSPAFDNWLEGNAVALPNGEMSIILRAGCASDDSAAVIRVSGDGKKIKFDGEFARLPGSSKKFTIRRDEKSGRYYALSNYIPEEMWTADNFLRTGSMRNTLALISAQDPDKVWKVESIILQSPNPVCDGFQYADWLFDGDDIIFASRTAAFDGAANAHNQHDANFLTFHRIKNFRERTLDMPPLNK